MSAFFFGPIARVPAAQRNSIFLSVLVGFLTGPGNTAASVFCCADPCQTLVVRIRLLTMCHVCTNKPDISAAATVAILWAELTGRGVAFAGGGAGVRLGLVVWGVVCSVFLSLCCVVVCFCCLGICCPAPTTVTLGSRIVGSGGNCRCGCLTL